MNFSKVCIFHLFLFSDFTTVFKWKFSEMKQVKPGKFGTFLINFRDSDKIKELKQSMNPLSQLKRN